MKKDLKTEELDHYSFLRLRDVNEYREKNNHHHKKKEKIKTKRLELRDYMYQLPLWRDLSRIYRSLHPLDELLLRDGIVKPSESVHHIVSPFDLSDEKLSYMLLLDDENIISLSSHIHGLIHGNPLELSDDLREYLTQRMKYIELKYMNKGYWNIILENFPKKREKKFPILFDYELMKNV